MNKTVIDEVSFYPIRPTEKGLIGFASCLYDNKLSLNSIAVYTTPDGDIRLVFPNKILPNTKEINIFYPINQQTYELIKEAVAEKIRELIEKAKNREPEGNMSEVVSIKKIIPIVIDDISQKYEERIRGETKDGREIPATKHRS